MGRKSNIQLQASMKAKKRTTQAEMKRLQEQNQKLKEQNSQLAIELDDHKAIIKELIKDRDQARQDLLGEKAFTQKIMECVNDIQLSAKINLNNLVSSSNCVTDILKMTHTLNTFNKKDRRSIHTTSQVDVTPTSNSLNTSRDVIKPIFATSSNTDNEVAKQRKPRFTTLNPLSFLLNLDPNEADDELPVRNNFYQVDEEQERRNEFEKNNCLDTIVEERLSTDESILSKSRLKGSLPNDQHTSTNASNPQGVKSSRTENSIQRRSNSLSDGDQIELIDDNEIITPNLPLLSSTIISSSPIQRMDIRRTRSFENRRKLIVQNENGDPRARKSHPSLDSDKTSSLSNTLRLDSSNPTVSKLEALKSYNLISVNNVSSTSQTSTPINKNKLITKSKMKRTHASRRRDLDKILMTSFSSPIILGAISLRSYRKSQELLPKKGNKKKFKQTWSETLTPKLLRPKTGSLKEPDLKNKLRR